MPKSERKIGTENNGHHQNKMEEIEQEEKEDNLDLLKAKILSDFNQLDNGKRRFTSGATLGYVTPWNNHGYDVAKWAASKFTHISPVWFQLRADGTAENEKITCRVDGTHDIDMGWVEQILLNNSAVRIVPRFIFEGWSGALLQQFLTEEQAQYRCVRALVNFLQRYNFNGAVMEIWLQIMSMTRGTAAQYLLELIEFWSEYFHRAGLEFILPLTPPLGANLQEIGIVNAQIMQRLLSAVDYVNLMTYDFPSSDASAVAPIDWVEANIRYAITAAGGGEDEEAATAAKILMGLNFYGYDRTNGQSTALLGNQFIELLSSSDAKLSFEANVGEHRLTFGDNGIAYYPSRKSIALRLKLAQTMGLGGVAIWDIGQGLDHFTFVL
ncbi:hypothetical protein niasHT_026900 [Heterodera trifolii]|uniref:Chitinase domain-containing protein 1 n=1 Tax=Heterodera trifolii TaxID=157864 RepID=A0ABD2JXY1_9BILA